MTVTTTTVTGPIYLPDLSAPENARIVFELSSWDRQEGEATFVTGPYVSDLDSNGDFSVELFTSTEGENQAVYNISVIYLTSTGQYKNECIGTISLAGEGPFNLAELNFVDPMTKSSFDLLAEVAAYVSNAETIRTEIQATRDEFYGFFSAIQNIANWLNSDEDTTLQNLGGGEFGITLFKSENNLDLKTIFGLNKDPLVKSYIEKMGSLSRKPLSVNGLETKSIQIDFIENTSKETDADGVEVTNTADVYVNNDGNRIRNVMNESGVLEEQDNVMKFEYYDGKPQGIRIEDNIKPLIGHSSDPQNWSGSNRFVITDSTEEYFDGKFMKKLAPNTTDYAHQLDIDTEDLTAGQYYCVSFTGKADGMHELQILFGQGAFILNEDNSPDTTSYLTCRIDLRTGAILRKDKEILDFRTKIYPNGLFKCWVTAKCVTSVTAPNTMFRILDGDGNSNFAGNNVSGIFWGNFQVIEEQSPQTDVITAADPTLSNTVDDRFEKPISLNLAKGFLLDTTINEAPKTKNNPTPIGLENDIGHDISIEYRNQTGKWRFVCNIDGTEYTQDSETYINAYGRTNFQIRWFKDPNGFADRMTWYINGREQGNILYRNHTITGTWHMNIGRDHVSSSKMFLGIIENITLIEGNDGPLRSELIHNVFAMGPSTTYNDVYGEVALHQFYPELLAQRLGDHVGVFNYGVSGQNSMEMYDLMGEALAGNPDILIICQGNRQIKNIVGSTDLSTFTISDASRFVVGTYIEVQQGTLSGERQYVERLISSISDDTITVTEPLDTAAVVGERCQEGIKGNVKAIYEAFDALGTLVIICDRPYLNFSDTGTLDSQEPDTINSQGAKQEEREIIATTVLECPNSIHVKAYEEFRELVKNGLEIQGDYKGQIEDFNQHHNAYGNMWNKFWPILVTLRRLGFNII